jgi:hypothetical protein
MRRRFSPHLRVSRVNRLAQSFWQVDCFSPDEKVAAIQQWSPEARLQFTIESRQLTNEYTHRPTFDVETRQTFIEAGSPDDAIGEFVRRNHSELVSLTRPVRGQESIATVKKDDLVYLVRVYAA